METKDIRNTIKELMQINNVEKIALGDLKIIKKVGEGGQAQVFKGTLEGKAVAVKQIFDVDWKNLAHEIVITANLSHPHIPKFYGIISESDNPCLVYDYIDGKTLDGFNPLDISDDVKLKMLKDLASVIEHMHSNKMIHRDLKPENLIINKSEELFVIDFGISKVITHKEFTRTRTKGTLNYLAPECLAFNDDDEVNGSIINEINGAVDIWSFGCLVSWLYSKCSPWSNKYPDHMIQKVLEMQKPFPVPDKITNENIINLITMCTKININERWNVYQVREFLDSI
jgi:serine/threonine protein kinase